MLPPLQILVFCHDQDAESMQYVTAIERAVQGGKYWDTAYAATGVDLNPEAKGDKDDRLVNARLNFYKGVTPAESASELLDSALHTLVVLLTGENFLKQPNETWQWLAAAWQHKRAGKDRHRFLSYTQSEAQSQALAGKNADLGAIQHRTVQGLGEFATRPALVAINVLHSCRTLLADGLARAAGGPGGALKLFISHAKLDGLPLALSLKHLFEALKWNKFYDADSLESGDDWAEELEKGVSNSFVVILRTEEYEGRFWCQREAQWADEYGTPALVVDARTRLDHGVPSLPLERLPVVRVPDGNLMRVVNYVVREGLRFVLFQRSAADLPLPTGSKKKIFGRPPSMTALLNTCRALEAEATTPHFLIFPPNPKLSEGELKAARALVQSYLPAATLATPDELIAAGVIAP